VNRSWLELHVT